MMDQCLNMIKGGLINIQSVGNKTHDLRSLIRDNKLEFLAITETWLLEYESAKINEMTPSTHNFVHRVRRERRGGGIGMFMSKSFSKVKEVDIENCTTFEGIQINCEYEKRKLIFIIIYRPPNTNKNTFINELRDYLETLNFIGVNLILCGDFNLWLDNPGDCNVTDFIDMLASMQLMNLVNAPTSSTGHILDLVCTDVNNNIIHNIVVENMCSLSPVHKLVTFNIEIICKGEMKKKIIFRDKRGFDSILLIRDIVDSIREAESNPCEHRDHKIDCGICFAIMYYETAIENYNKMCPIIEKDIIIRDNAPWFCGEVLLAKRRKRQKERAMNKRYSERTRSEFKQARNELNNLIKRKKERVLH